MQFIANILTSTYIHQINKYQECKLGQIQPFRKTQNSLQSFLNRFFSHSYKFYLCRQYSFLHNILISCIFFCFCKCIRSLYYLIFISNEFIYLYILHIKSHWGNFCNSNKLIQFYLVKYSNLIRLCHLKFFLIFYYSYLLKNNINSL